MMKWRFPNLTDSDFEARTDDNEEMLDKLAAKIQKTRVELEFLLAELQKC